MMVVWYPGGLSYNLSHPGKSNSSPQRQPRDWRGIETQIAVSSVVTRS